MRVYKSHALRRRSRRYSKKRKVFGRKAVRAIQKIASKPVETKWSINYQSLFNPVFTPSTWPTGGAAEYINIFDTVYRGPSPGIPSRSEVIGQKFQLRGISLRYLIAGPYARCTRVRVSVIQRVLYDNTGGSWIGASSGSPIWEPDDDGNIIATFQRFNMDQVKVLKSKTYTLNSGGNADPVREIKMWVPIRRMCTMRDEEAVNTTANQVVGPLKDYNYYAVVEWYDSEDLQQDAGAYKGYCDFKVYFKDP